MIRFASAEDYEHCRRLHRKHGTTYYCATLRFPPEIRRRVHAIYAFVRVADEWVDNPGPLSLTQQQDLLLDWRRMLEDGRAGKVPDHFAMRAFVDVLRETNIPVQEAHWFIDAMEMDLCVRRYQTYEALRKYMRGSASAVGVMMTYAMGGPLEADTLERAKALGEAMQLTNFLRDVSEDLERDRVYLPLEDLDRFGVREEDLLDRRFKPQFRELMEFEIARAREMYRYSDDGIAKLPEDMRKAVLISSHSLFRDFGLH